MRSIRMSLAFFALAFFVACGTVGTTFNDQAAAAERSVQLVQVASTALLRAGTITLAQDQQIQANVALVHRGILAAKAAQPKDPTAAAADLALAQSQLTALKVRTGVTP